MRGACCCTALLLACHCTQAAPRVTIELLPRAEVGGDAVVLGQVAHLSSPELGLLRQLVQLPIGRVPRDGQAAVVRRDRLAQWLRHETGLAAGAVAWQGSDSARVLRAMQPVTGADLAAAAVQALRNWLSQRGLAGELRVARVPRDLEVPAGELQLRPRSLEGTTPRRRMLVWVEVWCAGAFVRAVPVALEVEAGLFAAAPESSTSPASSREAQSPVLVERGAWATLHSTEGVVSLESQVTVLQDGRAGDHVRVRAPGGGGIVFARVVGPAQLELAP